MLLVSVVCLGLLFLTLWVLQQPPPFAITTSGVLGALIIFIAVNLSVSLIITLAIFTTPIYDEIHNKILKR
jgi:hypothetical protein